MINQDPAELPDRDLMPEDAPPTAGRLAGGHVLIATEHLPPDPPIEP